MTVLNLQSWLHMRWRSNKKKLGIAKYNLQLRLFRWSNNAKVKVRDHYRLNIIKYSTSFFFIVSITLSLIVPFFFKNFESKEVLGFYTSIGGMTGSMLAIIFTFMTLLANYALTEYPPEFFKISGNDRKQTAIYILLAILSITFFAIGLSYPGSLNDYYWLNAVTIFLLMFVFFLVFVSYTTMRSRLNPESAFKNYIVNPALKLINETGRKANKVAKLLASNPSSKDADIESHAKQQAQILVADHYIRLNNYIGIMYDYHAMLRERKKERAAINVLAGVQNILFRYIEARKGNSILLPTEYFMVFQLDSQDFFGNNFERLITKLSEYIDDNYVEGIRETLILYTNLGIKLSELDFAGIIRENPQFEQCFGYLNQARDMAMQKKNIEATFEIAKAYGNLGSVAILKDLDHSQSYAYDSIQKLYTYAIMSQQDSVAKQAIWSFNKISAALFSIHKINLNHTDFTLFINKYKKLINTYLIRQTNSYDLSPNNSQDILIPIRHMQNRFKILVKAGSAAINPNSTQDQHDALEIVDTIRSIARQLSDNDNSQVVDRYFYLELMRIMQSCILKLIELRDCKQWQKYHKEIDSKLNWAVNQFGFGLRNVDDTVENSNLGELASLVAIIGLYATSNGNDEISKISITMVGLIADAYMRTSSKDLDWEAPRIMMNIFIFSSVVLHENKVELLRHAKMITINFKISYIKIHRSNILNMPKGVRHKGPYLDQFNYEMSSFVRYSESSDSFMLHRSSMSGIETPRAYAERVFALSDEDYVFTKTYLKSKPGKQ